MAKIIPFNRHLSTDTYMTSHHAEILVATTSIQQKGKENTAKKITMCADTMKILAYGIQIFYLISLLFHK